MRKGPTQYRSVSSGDDDGRARLDTFERYFQKFPEFLDKILSWSPDYVVPVAKKGAKLLKASASSCEIDSERLKYRKYFELTRTDVKGKKIAIFDDATQYTSTLSEYRRYFEKFGGEVACPGFGTSGRESLHHSFRL